jgi:hypothetical protein
MSDGRPRIVIVDDRPHGLSALLDAIVRRYGADYRVAGHLSAHALLWKTLQRQSAKAMKLRS